MQGNATLKFGKITLPVNSCKVEWADEPCPPTKAESAVEFECQFTWSDAYFVRLELDHTVNFNECDKQAIANPWYSGWRTR